MTVVNLCLFNHPICGISDQVFFLETLLRDRGHEIQLSDRLHAGALNLVIENYRPASDGCNYLEAVERFCRRFDKRIGIVMTEHIERKGDDILFDGAPLTNRVYIGNKLSRFFGLLAQSESAFGFFTLGSLPELRSFHSLFLQHDLYHLPFPPLDLPVPVPADDDRGRDARRYDCVFTGVLTPYRKGVLSELERRFNVLVSPLVSEAERVALYRRAKVALNIPQDPSWPWISPMRVMFGLRMGRPTVNVGGNLQKTAFDRAVPIDEEIAAAVTDPAALYARQVEGYGRLVREIGPLFPDHAFRLWALFEGLAP